MNKSHIGMIAVALVLGTLFSFTNVFKLNQVDNLGAGVVAGVSKASLQTVVIGGNTKIIAPSGFKFQCNDKVDNDGDTSIDSADSGCHSDFNPNNSASYVPTDNDEFYCFDKCIAPKYQCSDKLDNDGDNLIDQADPGCHSDNNANNSASYVPTDSDEYNKCADKCVTPKYQCNDGVDNADPEDTLVDSADPGCHSDNNANNSASYVSTDNDESNTVVQNQVLFMGGINFTGPNNTVNRYNEVYLSSNMQNWNLISSNGAPGAISSNTRSLPEKILYFQNKYWIIGQLGQPTVDNMQDNDIWNSTDGVNWTLVQAHPPFEEYRQYSMTVFKDKIYVIGGYKYDHNYPAGPGHVWSSSNGIDWTVINSDTPFGSRFSSVLIPFNDNLYLIGGGVDWQGWWSDVWISSNGADWSLLLATQNAPFGDVGYSDGVVLNNKMFILGALSEGRSKGVWSSENGFNWTHTSDLNLLPDIDGSGFIVRRDAIVFDGKIWVGDSQYAAGNQNKLISSGDGITWSQSNVTLPWSPRQAYRFTSNQ